MEEKYHNPIAADAVAQVVKQVLQNANITNLALSLILSKRLFILITGRAEMLQNESCNQNLHML